MDLSIRYGELVCVVGPSGSGKSTMLHLVGTLDRPSAGRLAIDGHDVAGLSDRELSALRAQRIGFVFQQFHLAVGVPVRTGKSKEAARVTRAAFPDLGISRAQEGRAYGFAPQGP